ncbi:MAG: tetratricopeptide repeat protein [Flavobacteriales bacterium]
MFFQFNRSRKYGLIVFLLFFFTGIAIIIYLNQYPLQPRERDYAYAASFFAFSIWIGLGVLALYEYLRKYASNPVVAIVVSAVCLIAVPGVMAKDGWDDHDRSDTYTARDFAKNYLDSCAPNAILFTNGDNDTFPLWYVQEVEGYRTDVRVVNLSLLNTDWYINQMRRKAYDSDPVPFKMDRKAYRQGTRDYVPVIDKNKKGIYVDVKKVMQFITDPSQQAMFSGSKRMNYFPTKNFSLKVDSAKVVSNGTVPKGMEDKIVPEIQWKMNKNYILKNDMMILDLLANNDWERPIYFAITTGTSSYIGLQDYFQLEGLAYRLVPFKVKSKDGQTGYINTDLMYENLMHKFHWGGIDKKPIYLNDNNQRMCMNFRNNFARLADALVRKGDKKRAVEVLDRCMEVMPEYNVPYNFFMLPVAENYYRAGAKEKAEGIVQKLADVYYNELNYYLDLDNELYKQVNRQAQQAISVLYRLSLLTNETFKNEEIGPGIKEKFKNFQKLFQEKEEMSKVLPG